jgi:hypothetical protein
MYQSLTFRRTTLCKEAIDLAAQMSTRPTPGRLDLINNTIVALKGAGIWQKLDVFWMLAAETSQAGRLNWKSPGTFTCSEVNSPTFTANRGYAGNGSSSYLNTGWDASTNGVNYTQNGGGYFIWNRTSRAASTAASFGVYDSGAAEGMNLYARFTGAGSVFARVNDDNGGGGITVADSAGFYHAGRSSSSTRSIAKNGTTLNASISSTSSALSAFDIWIGCQNGDGVYTNGCSDEHACFGIGNNLEAETAVLYNIINAHLRAIGAA